MLRYVLFFVAAFFLMSLVLADGPEIAEYPNLYREMRAAAEKSNAAGIVSAFSMQAADDAARKGEAALKSRATEAARLYRTAFWRLPRLPRNIPPHLAHVLGNFEFRHAAAVTCLSYDPNGEYLASSSADDVVRLWNLLTGRMTVEYRQHTGRVRCVLMLASGDVVSAADKDIHIWDKSLEKPTRKLTGSTGPVTCVAASGDGKWLASSGEDRVVRVWELATGKEAYSLGVQNSGVNAVDVSRDGTIIASVNGDGTAVAWDASTKTRRKVLEQRVFGDRALGVRVSPDGKSIAVCGERAAKLIALPAAPAENTEPVGVVRRSFDGVGGHSDQVTSLAFSPDGKLLATGGRDFSVRLWDVHTGQMTRSFLGHSDEVSTLAFAPNGWQLASAGPDQSIRLWDLEPVAPSVVFAGSRGPVWAGATSADGKLVASAGADKTVRVWDAETGRTVHSLTGHQQPVTAVAFAGASIISAGGDRAIRVWPASGGDGARLLEGHEAAVLAIAVSADGKKLVSGGADRFVRGHDIDSGAKTFAWPGHASVITAVAMQNDNIASASADGFVKVWQGPAGNASMSWKAHEPGGTAALAFSPDGQILYSCGGDRLIKVWSLDASAKREPIAILSGHTGPVSSIAVSRDGRFLVSGSADTVVKVWDLSARTELTTFRGHSEWVASVAFFSDGASVLSTGTDGKVLTWRLNGDASESANAGHSRAVTSLAALAGRNGLASGSRDRSLIFWDLVPVRERRVGRGSKADIIALASSPDGRRVLSSSEDRKVRLFDVPSGQEIRAFDPVDRVLSMVFVGDKQFLTWQFRDGTDDDAKSIIHRFDTATGKSEEVVVENGRTARCLSFSADGSLAAIGAPDGTLRIWKLDTKQRLGPDVPAHAKPVADVVCTPDKRHVISAAEDGEIKVWPLATQFEKPLATIKAEVGTLIGLAAGPTGARFAAFGAGGAVQVFDTVTGKVVRGWTLKPRIGAVAFTADGRQIAVGNADGTVFVLDLPSN